MSTIETKETNGKKESGYTQAGTDLLDTLNQDQTFDIQKYGPEMQKAGEKIAESINSKFIKDKLIEARNIFKDFQIIGDIIGNCVLYNTLFKEEESNDKNFKSFINELYNLNNEKYDDEEKSIRKAKIIAQSIAAHLNIPLTEDNSAEIKKYFLKEYNEHGYVYHSFPNAYFKNVSEKGLQANNENKNDNTTYNDIYEIQEIFVKHGIYSALGGAGIYGGEGIYYDHRQGNIYSHAIFGPERFSFFTSSNHHTITGGIENEPFALRDKVQCRKNIDDLCKNAGLNDEETKKVTSFFEKTYNMLTENGSENYFTLIPKAKVGKNKNKLPEYLGYIPIPQILQNDSRNIHNQFKELINTIRYTLEDWGKDYQEHKGNVYHESIQPAEMNIIKLPEIKEIIKENINFKHETKAKLTNKVKIKELKNEIENVKKIAPDRVPDRILKSLNAQIDSWESDKSETYLRIKDIFGLKSKEAIEFKGKLIEFFKFYENTIIPIISKLKVELKGTENEIIQEDEDMNHGFNKHTKNVVIRGIFYALMKGIDPIPVIIAGAAHDLKHINIPGGGDKKHGPQAVPLVDIIINEYNKISDQKIDNDTKSQIKYAVKNHMSDHGEPDSMPIAQCLNDADRTWIARRDGYSEKFFSTEAAKKIADGRKAEFIKYFQDIGIDYDTTSIQ